MTGTVTARCSALIRVWIGTILLCLSGVTNAGDMMCLAQSWAGVWTSKGSFGSEAAIAATPSIYYVRQKDGGYTLFSHDDNVTLLGDCNDTGTFCDNGDESYRGTFIREKKFNTFTLVYVTRDKNNSDKHWVMTVTGKCSSI